MTSTKDSRTDVLLGLLNYHNNCMVIRRAIGFKAFLSLMALYLIVLKGFYDLWCDPPIGAVNALTYFYLFFSLIYIFFMLQIERKSKDDREKYFALEDILFEIGSGEIEIDFKAIVKRRKESLKNTIWWSWATTWPILGVLATAASCIWIIRH